MSEFQFSEAHIKKIGSVLGLEIQKKDNCSRFELINEEKHLQLNFELYSNIDINGRNGNLLTIYSTYGIHQLQFCSGFIASELLGEVTFLSEYGDKISAAIIEKEGGYSFYANVDKGLISSDFTKLGPEVVMCGLALSIIEPVIDGGDFDEINGINDDD
jgi:hypothetical protein